MWWKLVFWPHFEPWIEAIFAVALLISMAVTIIAMIGVAIALVPWYWLVGLATITIILFMLAG